VKLLVGRLPWVAHVAPQLAQVRSEGGSWNVGPNLRPRSRKARHNQKQGGRIGEEPNAIWR
jgi:hypothetical protein